MLDFFGWFLNLRVQIQRPAGFFGLIFNIFTSILGEDEPILTFIFFQLGWNHQLVFLIGWEKMKKRNLNGCHCFLLRGATKVMVKASCIYMWFANPGLNNDLNYTTPPWVIFLIFTEHWGRIVSNHAIHSLNIFLQMDFWGDDCFFLLRFSWCDSEESVV